MDQITKIASGGLYRDKSNTIYIGTTDKGERGYRLFGKLPQEDKNRAIFEIGSISKVFTSVLLADLIKKNKLSLEEPLHHIFPEFKKALIYKDSPVTVKHLSTHTSGLPREDRILKRKIIDKLNPYQNYSNGDLHNFFTNYTLKNINNWKYSNLGYALLRLILEKVTSKTYDKLIEETLVNSLKLADTTMSLDYSQQVRRVKAKTKNGIEIPPLTVDGIKGAGGLYSTMDDMLKFIELNLNVHHEAYAVLSMTQQVHATGIKDKFNMGLGWFMEKIEGVEDLVYWTGGTTVGFHTYAGLIPKEKRGIVIFASYHLTKWELLKVLCGAGPIVNTDIAREFFMNGL